MKRNRFYISIFISLVIVISIIIGLFVNRMTNQPISESKEYSDNRYFLYTQIQKENQSDFQFTEISKKDIPLTINPDLYLKSDQFLSIARSYLKNSPESSDNWKIESVSYNTPCDQERNGFSTATLFFYSQTNSVLKYSITEEVITIYPQIGYLETFTINSNQWLTGKKELRIDNLKISPEEAVKISMESGGSKIQKQGYEGCVIKVWGNIEKDTNGWDVRYTGANFKRLFYTYIDYQTGVAQSKNYSNGNN
jgi:hypothetical protein